MKLFIAALSALVALSLTACESQDDQGQNNGSNNTTGDNQTVNQTDYSVCGVTTAPHTIEGRWQLIQTQGTFRLTTSLYIQNGTIQLVNDCNLSGNTLRATVASTAVYDYSTFQVTRAVSDVQKIDRPNFNMSCHADLNTLQMNYSFQGNCLVFSQANSNSKPVVYVPF